MRFRIAALAALFAILITSLPACKKLMSVASAATPSPTTCWTVMDSGCSRNG